ncbi:hypothetical protein [Candidatus Poriferisodalis sp.]|uniref:hypothetical protein n=1 Tax=Candidatus Poriferisodalis sp. TaxID=3101277 RepID=UPI003B029AD8
MQRDTPQVFVWASVGMGVLLAVLVVHLRTAIVAGGPVAVPDIPAYLGIAQWVGGDGFAPGDIPFQPGYGLLIAPLVAISQVSLLGTQGEVVHYLALVVNSLAATAAVLVAGRLGLVCSQRWWIAGAVALIAAVHPSLSSASRIAWPETLLTLAVLVVALAVAFAAKVAGSGASRRAWARAGLVATLAVALHARMIVLVAAVVLTALLCRIGRRAWASLGGGLLVGGAATALALSLTGTWPTERLSEAAQLDRGAEPIATVLGQLLALGGGTVGLGVIGLVAGLGVALRLCLRWPVDDADEVTVSDLPAETTGGLLRRRRRREPLSRGADRSPGARPPQECTSNLEPLTVALVCLALGALGAVLLGGWTLTGSARADALLYGRYVDPWAVPLAVAALAWLAARPTAPRGESATSGIGASPCSTASRRSTLTPSGSAVLGTATAVLVISFAVVVAVAGDYDAAPRRIMTLSFSPAWTWLDDRLSAVAVAALAVTLLGTLLAAAARRSYAAIDAGEPVASAPRPASDSGSGRLRRRTAVTPTAALGTLVAGVLALGTVGTVSNHRHLADVGAVARDQVTAAEAVSGAVEDDGLICLAHDRMSVPDYALWLYRLELPEITHERVRLNAGDRPCSELVIADDDLAQRCTNARHLVDEPAGSWALWHLPGRRCIGL